MTKTKPTLLPLICICFILFTTITGCKKEPHCEYLICKNGGECHADTCACAPGYFGALCENAIRDQFLGNYVGNLYLVTPIGTDTLPNVSITVAAGPDSLMEVTLTSSNLGTLKGAISMGGGLNVPSQTNTFGSVSAAGSFYGNTLNFSYSEVTVILTVNGSFTGTKQ